MTETATQAGMGAPRRHFLRIAVACGGTGGHVFPGLATADNLRRRGHEVVLYVAGRSEEHAALGGWDGPVVMVRSPGPSLPFLRKNVRSLLGMLPALASCLKAMRRSRPGVLLAMGSYASIAPALAAKLLGVPLVLHEANAVPGRAIRFLSPFAHSIAVGFDETGRFFAHRRVVLTGMPLRTPSHETPAVAALARLPENTFTVLVMGGSRGAHELNLIASGAIAKMRSEGMNVQVIHLAGEADEAVVRGRYQGADVKNAVFGFLRAVDQAYVRASFAVCRAGASTCAELARYAVPALLVPYPFAVRRHQLANARALERSGSADVIEENALDERKLADYLAAMMKDRPRLDRMSQAARNRCSGDAASNLADLLESAAVSASRQGNEEDES